jgi:hypothetical protein
MASPRGRPVGATTLTSFVASRPIGRSAVHSCAPLAESTA